ncbi:MAG: gamma carbonic anhydrase family protein [SAR324 cluster bacterium]|nr:gamma carbonic anhydrase family protein [SAR324 cluster bacterium]
MSGLILPFENTLPIIDPEVFIAHTAVVIGDVEIGKDSSIWYGCVVRGDVNVIRIGERTNIQDGTVVHVSSDGQGTYIGNDVTIGHMALLHACTLEDRTFIGMKACVMDGAVVEAGAMVASGALVTPGKRVKTGEMWAGSPAKFRRNLTENEMTGFAKTSPKYVQLAKKHIPL